MNEDKDTMVKPSTQPFPTNSTFTQIEKVGYCRERVIEVQVTGSTVAEVSAALAPIIHNGVCVSVYEVEDE